MNGGGGDRERMPFFLFIKKATRTTILYVLLVLRAQKIEPSRTNWPFTIDNGIYGPWDIPRVHFAGDFDFDSRRRKLESDFDMIELLGLLKIGWGGRRSRRSGGRQDWVARTARSSRTWVGGRSSIG